MVGSGGSDRSKEAVGMMALHEALRNVCLNSDWIYSVFWSIRPRPRTRGGNGCKVAEENGSLMLMWEDGFCRRRVADCLEDIDEHYANLQDKYNELADRHHRIMESSFKSSMESWLCFSFNSSMET
ncbi:hypothetical protein ACHQM5_030295 [Ranunculus cassubicifolius]